MNVIKSERALNTIGIIMSFISYEGIYNLEEFFWIESNDTTVVIDGSNFKITSQIFIKSFIRLMGARGKIFLYNNRYSPKKLQFSSFIMVDDSAYYIRLFKINFEKNGMKFGALIEIISFLNEGIKNRSLINIQNCKLFLEEGNSFIFKLFSDVDITIEKSIIELRRNFFGSLIVASKPFESSRAQYSTLFIISCGFHQRDQYGIGFRDLAMFDFKTNLKVLIIKKSKFELARIFQHI